MPRDALLDRDAGAPGRQRPEEILASTLSSTPHPAATDGWSERGRRIFLLTMAAAGALLVVAGLLVTNELGPRSGTPAPLQTGPGNGVAGQLLPSTSAGEAPTTPPASAPLPLPLPAAPTARPATSAPGSSPAPVSATAPTTATNTPSSTPARSPSSSTTVPCAGLVGKGLQTAQVSIPCQVVGGL